MELVRPHGRRVTPRVIGDNVFCPCGSLMFAVIYESFEDGSTWIYWSCHRDGGDVTCAIPLPPELRAA